LKRFRGRNLTNSPTLSACKGSPIYRFARNDVSRFGLVHMLTSVDKNEAFSANLEGIRLENRKR
jgi:hypothetical protein